MRLTTDLRHSADVKNDWSCTSTPSTPSWRGSDSCNFTYNAYHICASCLNYCVHSVTRSCKAVFGLRGNDRKTILSVVSMCNKYCTCYFYVGCTQGEDYFVKYKLLLSNAKQSPVLH